MSLVGFCVSFSTALLGSKTMWEASEAEGRLGFKNEFDAILGPVTMSTAEEASSSNCRSEGAEVIFSASESFSTEVAVASRDAILTSKGECDVLVSVGRNDKR